MYSSDESTSSEIETSDIEDKKSSNTSKTEQHNNKEVAVPSTSEQSLNATYFLSQSTSDVEQSDVLSTETELSTSALTTSEDGSSAESPTSKYSSECLPSYRNLLFYSHVNLSYLNHLRIFWFLSTPCLTLSLGSYQQ